MSIGSHLLTRENLDLVRKSSWKYGRPQVLEIGMRYYGEHPEEAQRIAANLAYLGLPSSGAALDDVLHEMVIDYYEKLFVLVKTYEAYWIAKNRIEFGDSLQPLFEAKQAGKAVFIGQAHFGATYLMGIALMVHGFDLNIVGKFPEPAGSLLDASVRAVAEKHQTGTARILNLADPGVDVPLEMMTTLRQRRIVSNVYDEHNQFCRPMDLLGRKVMGGTGMDLILRNFSDENTLVVTPFLIRTSDETFRYELDCHSLGSGDIIKSFFSSLEKRIRAHYAQWYFIHEVHESFVEQG